MSRELVEAYARAWVKHVKVDQSSEGRENLRELLDFYSDGVEYEDVPSGQTYFGHEGVTQVSEFVTSQIGPELKIISLQTDGDRFAFEFTMQAPGVDNVGRAVAVGVISDGKVTSHRDFYDLASVMKGFGPVEAGQQA